MPSAENLSVGRFRVGSGRVGFFIHFNRNHAMVSALRQRAEAAAGSGDGGERVEPTLMPEGAQPPVVTDEVVVPGVPIWRRAGHLVLRVLQTLGAMARRVPLQSVALVALGAGLALFSLGLASYLRSSPQAAGHAPGVAMAGASAPESSDHAEGVPRTAEAGPSAAHTPAESAHETKAPAPEAEGKDMAQEGAKAEAKEDAKEAKEEVKDAARAEATAIPDEAKEDTKPESMLDPAYGKDSNANGVPDALERWLTRTLHSVPTQESARQYYRTVLPLASKLHLGVALSRNEKLTALRAAECYLLTANDEGLRMPPNLNDKVLMLGDDPATRMKALFAALQGVDFPLSVSRQQACG